MIVSGRDWCWRGLDAFGSEMIRIITVFLECCVYYYYYVVNGVVGRARECVTVAWNDYDYLDTQERRG